MPPPRSRLSVIFRQSSKMNQAYMGRNPLLYQDQPRFSNPSYRSDSLTFNYTQSLPQQLLHNIFKNQNMPCKETAKNNKGISDLKMATKLLQGVPPLLNVCINPLIEDNNRNFSGGSPPEISFWFLWRMVSICHQTIWGVDRIFCFILHFSNCFVRVFS